MIKKVVIAGLFLGGGYYFIKKILPTFSKRGNEFDFQNIEYEAPEFYRGKGGQTQPISIDRNKSIEQVRDREYYGQSMGSQQEIGSESPIGMGYVYGNNRKIYL